MANYFYFTIIDYTFELENAKYLKYFYEERINVREYINKDFENDENNNLLEIYGNLFCVDLNE